VHQPKFGRLGTHEHGGERGAEAAAAGVEVKLGRRTRTRISQELIPLLTTGPDTDQFSALVATFDDHAADESDAWCVVLVLHHAGIEAGRFLGQEDIVKGHAMPTLSCANQSSVSSTLTRREGLELAPTPV
jgi:hypothetical protein